MKPLVPAAVLVFVIGGGAPAAACSCVMPRGGQFLVPAEVEIPANAVGIPWFGTRGGSAPEGTFTVRELSGGEGAPARVQILQEGPIFAAAGGFDFIALVSPAGGFRPGASYELDYQPPPVSEDDLQGLFQGKPHKVKVIVARERLAAGEGRAEVAAVDTGLAPLDVLTYGGSCSARVLAHQVGLKLRLPQGLERWRGALLFGARVDGKLWRPAGSLCEIVPPGRSWVDVGAELAFTACRPAPEPPPEGRPEGADGLEESDDPRTAAAPEFNLPEGDHLVEMIAWLPGTDAVLRGSTRIRLDCPDTGEPAAGGQPPPRTVRAERRAPWISPGPHPEAPLSRTVRA